ncbi:MAG: DUF418 domain-containing protein [Labilithrix sp.]|nr:DUF418 domain-containing protein [Labilithrix sp.]MCW5809518.1 DUF418 domain-containing protein [Labilithrix sp.]
MKAFILFSLLFGAGLAATHERAPQRFARLVLRRLGLLLAIGLLHFVLLSTGDVLTLYALLGLVAAPIVARARVRVLVALALALFVLHVAPLPYPRPFASEADLAEHVEAARHVYPYGSFRQVLAFRLVELRPTAALLAWTAPRTLGLFFLGAVVWKTRFFRNARMPAVAAVLCALGAVATWLVHVRGVYALDGPGSVALSLGYGAAIASVAARGGLRVFAPIGRMALTSYLTQSIVLGFVFYGYGLGLFGAIGRLPALGIVVALFGAQMIFARWWLARFRYGPLEWAWRSFTYGAWQPFAA